jgi:CHAT domain-containing protein/Tfp pilus assembly protein PilF
LADGNVSINKPSSNKVGGNRTSTQSTKTIVLWDSNGRLWAGILHHQRSFLRKKCALLSKTEYFQAAGGFMSRRSLILMSRCFSLVVISIFALLESKAAAGTQATVTPLEPGKHIERSITGDEVHSYTLTLTSGQYAHVVVDQRGVDALVAVYGPDGNKLFEIDSPNVNNGPEPVSLLADPPGTYRIEVQSQTKPTGRYEIKLETIHQATQQERSRVAAQKLSADARVLRDQRTEQSYEQAIEKHLAAVAIWQSLADKEMEASTLHQAGWLYGDIGQYQKALDCYAQAAAIYKSRGDRRGEGNILNNTAWIYSELGEDQKALEMYDRVVTNYKEAGDEDPIAMSNIGASYAQLGQFQRALDIHLRVFELRRANRDEAGQSKTLNNIANCYYNLGNNAKALDFYNRSLELMVKVGDDYYTATVLNNIGALYRRLGDYDRALNHFNQALAMRRSAGDRRGIAITLAQMAYLERDHGNLAEARKRIEEALEKFEWVRSRVASTQLRASFLASVQQHREFYIDLLMRMQPAHPGEQLERIAFNASETGRARSLLQLLGEAGSKIHHNVDPSLLTRRRDLAELIEAKAQNQMRLLNGKHTEAEAAAALKEISVLTTEFEQLESRIRETSPQFASLIQPVPLTVDEVQKRVLDPDTLLLEYSLGEEKSFLWAVTPDSIKSYELPKRGLIEPVARRVYELLTARTVNVANETLEQRQQRLELAEVECAKASETLSKMVLRPAAGEFKNKRLLIVSDGVLQFIPFAALPDPAATDARPLIVDHEVVLAPSASVVSLLRQETASRKPASRMLAVLADPVFSNDDPRVAAVRLGRTVRDDKTVAVDTLRSTESGLRRLRFSRHEADEIARLAGNSPKLQAVDFAANRKLATSAELSQYRLIHFATHGIVDNYHPELSGIVLSLVDEKGQPQNGFLRLYDLYNLKLSADLVVLSACQTALGKEVRGEGLVGLTRGFMYAGAPRVVSSLWQIDDRASAEFMKRFYEGMLKLHLRPAAALRAAQISMHSDKRWHEPHYWAAFTIQGEWR